MKKNLIIIALAPLALLGTHSLFDTKTEMHSSTQKTSSDPAVSYKKKTICNKNFLIVPETCLADEDTLSFKPNHVATRTDVEHRNIMIYRKDNTHSSVNIKF